MQETSKIPPKVIAAIVATGLMSFCGVIVETAMNISFPKLMTEFNVTTNVVQWMTSHLLTGGRHHRPPVSAVEEGLSHQKNLHHG